MRKGEIFMKKKYRNFIIAMMVIPFIAITLVACWTIIHMNPEPQPTKNEYEILKDYCMQIATGTATVEEIEEKENVEIKRISTSSDGKTLRIEIANNRCRVAAIFLLSEAKLEVKEGAVYKKNIIISEDVLYLKKSLITTRLDVLLNSIAVYIVWVIVVLLIFVVIPQEYKKCVKKESEQGFKK